MGDSRLLLDTFDSCYNKGIDALDKGDFESARRNILLAAETLLKLAKESTGVLRTKRLKRADELVELASQIEEKSNIKIASTNKYNYSNNTKNSTNKKGAKYSRKENSVCPPLVIHECEDETYEEAMAKLNSLIGLNKVKEQVRALVTKAQFDKERRERGLPVKDEFSKHMVFVGNPGTGKTTVARIIGSIFKSIGILSRGQTVEGGRDNLVAGYKGQTSKGANEVIDAALGGVLFIDEAYMLYQGKDDDWGKEALDNINKRMDTDRDDLCVIAAGYSEDMDKLISSNEGLESRFKNIIEFEDYTPDELFEIFKLMMKNSGYIVTDDALEAVKEYLASHKIKGNARGVRNLVESIGERLDLRLSGGKYDTKLTSELLKKYSDSELQTITIDDLPFRKSNKKDDSKKTPEIEKKILKDGVSNSAPLRFNWDDLPSITFDDIAGLQTVKDAVKSKVLLPLKYPEAYEGYAKKNGGGLFLYGAPGTGKTMIAAAIANEIGAKFCSVKPSDLLNQGAGNTEKAVKDLFAEARRFPCSVIYFDEMDSIAQKSTRSSYSKQLRSEMLAQIQGVESYGENNGNILFLISATNKPWDVDSAFMRPGRFGTKVYVGLPDFDARKYMINARFKKVLAKGIVTIDNEINIDDIATRTEGFNGSDITNLLDRIDEISALRGLKTGIKQILKDDVEIALTEIHSSVQIDDIEKLIEWKSKNDN